MTTADERHERMIRLLSRQIGNVLAVVGCLTWIVAAIPCMLPTCPYESDQAIQALGQPAGFPTHLPLIAIAILLIILGARCVREGQRMRKALSL